VHLIIPSGRHGINFVNENDGSFVLFASVPELRKLGLTFSVKLGQNAFQGHVNKRYRDFLSNNFGAGGFSCSRGPFKKDSLRLVGFYFHSRGLSDLVVNLGILEGQ
jgi:hypothetical protein